MPIHIITGRISDQQDKPLERLAVRAYDQDPISPDDVLGEATNDVRGLYRIEFDATRMQTGGRERGGPDVYIRVFEGERQLAESPVRSDAGANISINLMVNLPAGPERPASPEPAAATVTGRLTGSEGRAIAGALVLAFHKSLRVEQRLGRAITDVRGMFTIPYDHPKRIRRQGLTLDSLSRGKAKSTFIFDPKISSHP